MKQCFLILGGGIAAGKGRKRRIDGWPLSSFPAMRLIGVMWTGVLRGRLSYRSGIPSAPFYCAYSAVPAVPSAVLLSNGFVTNPGPVTPGSGADE